MRKRKNSLFMLMLISIILLFAFVSSVESATHTYYYENFGSPDANGQNPYSATGEIPYTYAEFGWSGGTAGVNANANYYINTSDSGVVGWSNFTFNSSLAYNYFEFRFQYLNSWTTNMNHSGIEFRLSGNVGDICFIKVYGANTTVGGSTNRLVLLNYNSVEVANVSITKSKWYTVRLNPDYDTWDNNIDVTVYDVTAGSYIVNEQIGLNSNTAISKFYMDETPSTETVCILLDNFVLVYSVYSTGETTSNYITQYVFTLLFALAMVILIFSMIVSGNLTPETMVMTIIIAILGFVTIMILSSLG